MALFLQPLVQILDSSGHPRAGCIARFFATGTLTHEDVFTTDDLDVPHDAEGVIANADGIFPPIYLDPTVTYRVRFYTSAGVLIENGDIDPYNGGATIGTSDISDGAITTDKLAALAVTSAKLAAQSVSNAKLVNMPTLTVKGNRTASTASPTDVTAAQLASDILGSIMVGSVHAFPHDAWPTSVFLLADGSAVSRTTYARLFAAYGTTFGSGDGSTTFNLPDYRGAFLRGRDNGRSLDPDGTRAYSNKQANAVKDHTHNLNPGGTYPGGGSTSKSVYGAGNRTDDSTVTAGVVSGSASETRPENYPVEYVIWF